MPSNHLILCHPLLLLPSTFPSIRVFSNELALLIRWPKYWSLSFSISPSNEYSGLVFLLVFCLITLQSKRLSRVYSSSTISKHQFFGAQPFLRCAQLSHPYMTSGKTIDLKKFGYLKNHHFVEKVMSLPFNTLSRFVSKFV